MISLHVHETSPLRAIRAAAWAITAMMLLAIVVGVASAEDGAVAELLDNVWARVTILDLYVSLGVIGTWIAWRERSLPRTLLWFLALVVGGSVAVGAYIAIAAGRVRTMNELLCGSQDIRSD